MAKRAGPRAPAKKSVRPSSAAHERGAEPRAGNKSFPVVGIGASAGGLEAFRQLLEHLPVDTGMAFVLVQHLDPTHDSILTELLSRSTRMPVSEVSDGLAVAPDHVYVIPRNTNMAIAEGVLRLLPREEARGRHRPIDYFLRTLAEDQSHRAIGVILSGTASDGTLGLEAIKAEGGITFAEDPKSAKYDSMPRSAIAAGHVDFILTPEGIAQELTQISRHPYVTPPAATATAIEEETTGRIRDVTGLQQFQAAIRRSEIRYRRLFEAARDGVLIMDPQTRKILDANPFMAELLGYTCAELLGRELFEIGLLRDEEASRDAFRELQEKGFIRYEDLPLETKTGERREVEMVSNLYSEDGEEIIQCNIRDISERKRAEEALRESEERYRTLFDLGPVAVYSCDTSGVIKDFNRRAAELWGREPAVGDTDERFCGSFKMFRPDGSFMPHEQCPMAEVLSGKISEARDAEVFIEQLDGSRITVIVNIRPLKNERGEVTGAINCFYDITERKQAEEARARLAAIVESSDDAIASKDLNGVITSWNVGAERLFGYTAPEIVGQPVTILIPLERFDEETTILEHIRRAEPVKHYETVRRRKDGTLLDVSLTVSPILDSQGHIVGASKIARDITGRKQAEKALRESETRFRELADAMPQIVWAARPDGYIDYYNRRWYEYTGFGEGYGQESWEPILHPDDVQRCVDTYFGCIREGTPYQIEYRFKDRFRGGYRWFMGRALPIKNEQGEIVRWFGTCTDIDDVKHAEEERENLLASERAALAQAEAANRVKDEFLATISHELRTPLNAMMGWADMLRRGAVDASTAVHAADTIARNARMQNQLISDLLDVSRIISGKLRLEVSAVELAQVIEAAIDTVRPAADARRVDVRLLSGDAVGLVSGDASRLQQVVWNLLSNAIKYSPGGGRVDVLLEREGTNVAIIVRDTGEGIRPELLPHIFDRFRQADSATTRRHGGLGLGLAIVHHLVEAHGGTVHANSGGAGQGATFTVTLPLIAVKRNESDAQPSDGDAKRRQTPIQKSLNAVRVLVVDDDRDNRELLSLALNYAGAEVRVGASVREALAILDQWIPDVLVSDIGMPEEDGYALIKELRSRDAERGGLIPALALTGYARETDATHAREAGFQLHLTKPVESATLIAAVASFARLRRSRLQTPGQIAGELSEIQDL